MTFSVVDGQLHLSSDDHTAASGVFTQVDQLASLAGSRWVDADGNVFVLSVDGRNFYCEATGQRFTRAIDSPGVFRKANGQSDMPFALLSDGWSLNLYVSVDGQSILHQAFAPVKD